MTTHDANENEADPNFPSGPWRGFYVYPGNHNRHRMDLTLTFGGERLRGDGRDDIGIFVIRGSYSRETLDVNFVKTYPGSHDVYYKGCRDGKGIWGTWEITSNLFSLTLKMSGGFHIWPGGNGAEDAAAESAAAKDATVEIARHPMT